jgi:hypothetical protein
MKKDLLQVTHYNIAVRFLVVYTAAQCIELNSLLRNMQLFSAELQ